MNSSWVSFFVDKFDIYAGKRFFLNFTRIIRERNIQAKQILRSAGKPWNEAVKESQFAIILRWDAYLQY